MADNLISAQSLQSAKLPLLCSPNGRVYYSVARLCQLLQLAPLAQRNENSNTLSPHSVSLLLPVRRYSYAPSHLQISFARDYMHCHTDRYMSGYLVTTPRSSCLYNHTHTAPDH